MKKVLWMLICLVALSACASPATPTPAVSPDLPEPSPVVSPDLPKPTPSASLQYHPLSTITQIEEIDLVLAAVVSGDAQAIRNLFGFTTTTCMTVNALGGPPPCREGEAEGTMVEVLPILESEGHYFRKDETGNFTGLKVIGLYAVYRVPATVFSDVNNPVGDYAIAYVGEGNLPEVALHVTNGKIVRIDYIFGYPEYNNFLPQGVTEFILEPLK